MGIRTTLNIWQQNRKWRKKNQHNTTTVRNIFDLSRVTVGRYTYGDLYVLLHNHFFSLSIGDFCSVAPNVSFVVESDHPLNHLSTFPFKNKCLNMGWEAKSKGNIIVDDDVWIGCGSIILSGVHIGQGAVVAAGSVVNKDVPAYAIVAGVPAKIIKYRFSDYTRKKLMQLDYKKLSLEKVKEMIEDLYQEIDESNVERIINRLTDEKEKQKTDIQQI